MSNNRNGAPPEPKPGEWMAAEDFETVLRLTPLVAIDLVVRSPEGRVLLGRRTYEPAKNALFVPGGRITKNELRSVAFKRISQEELGIELNMADARFLGVSDHIYNTNRFGKEGFGTHYVTLAYEVRIFIETAALPKEQHGEYVWLTTAELLDSPDVHENTKAYFR